MAGKDVFSTFVSKGGAFVRPDSGHRNVIGEDERFPAEAGRYHLYISFACPWANRCFAVRRIKGLEDAISVSVVHYTWQRTRPQDPEDTHSGWVFRAPGDAPLKNTEGYGSFECDDALIPDSVNNATTIRELYDLSGDTHKRYTVPVLWDKKLKMIVNNESSEIIRMFNDKFNEFAKHPEVNLFPEHMAKAMDEVDEWVYSGINNGVYRCGFASSQQAYEEAVHKLFDALDRVEDILSRQRYLAGNEFTASDLRLFMTLVRFDEVYVVYFKTNKKLIKEYPNMYNYVKDVFQTHEIGSTINMRHIKGHYYTAHPNLNKYGIIPVGEHGFSTDHFREPHDRDRFSKQ